MNTINWNTYARAYDLLREVKPYRAMHACIATVIARHYARHNGLILDAGCGTGNLLTELRTHHLQGRHLVGIDASPNMCAIARAKHGISGTCIHETNLDTQLPFPDNMFCVAVCINALYAVHSPLETIREFRRVLRPDGILIIATPHDTANIGLILKNHASSEKPDSYWMQFSQGGDVAHSLLMEAFRNDNFDSHLLEILFSTNTTITKSTQMHFMSKEKLTTICQDANLTVQTIQKTYADQALFVCATPTT